MVCFSNGALVFKFNCTRGICKALEHIATAFWPPCAWNATFCYTILSDAGAHRVDFGAR